MPPIASYALVTIAGLVIFANIIKHPIGLMSFHINIPGVLLVLGGILLHKNSTSDLAFYAALAGCSLGGLWLLFWAVVLLAVNVPV